jgi:broad specificity phosphatase PhoE
LLAFRLSFAKFSEIISSDLGRATETTKEILAYHDENTPVENDSRVREKAAGVLEGKTMFEYKTTAIVNKIIYIYILEIRSQLERL